MVSILIPIYNFDCSSLIGDLNELCVLLSYPCEIIALDDGSDEKFRNVHRQLDYASLRYDELPNNIGRAAIRNELVRRATFDILIFMDCDSAIVSKAYLKNYLTAHKKGSVICGGRVYGDQPSHDMYILHWTYGNKRESRERKAFHSNNFMASKEIMIKCPFNENFKHYGHEDTAFGIRLEKLGIRIERIENPVRHLELMTCEEFLRKQYLAIKNIERLKKDSEELPMVRMAHKLQKWRLDGLFLFVWNNTLPTIKRSLKSGKPSLFLLDVYKLGLYLKRSSL